MKRLVFSLIAIFILVLVFFLFQRTNLESTNSSPIKNLEEIKITKLKPQIEKTEEIISHTQQCEDYKKLLSNPKFETIENRRWSNYHIKYTDGETYRIRYFYDDGPNGEYKKTVLYKEDESEFAHIIKVFRGFETKSLKDYFERGEVIWEEQAYEVNINGKPAYWRKINDEFVDLNIDEELSCL